MAEPPSTGGGNDDTLSSHVFIAIISSVGAVILFIAVMMICAFACLCYNEYRKRRSQIRKPSDRVGLLRSATEEEDIVSDQDTEMAAVGGMKSQYTSQDGAPVATTPEKRSPLVAGSNKVHPSSSTPPQQRNKQDQREPEKDVLTNQDEAPVATTPGKRSSLMKPDSTPPRSEKHHKQDQFVDPQGSQEGKEEDEDVMCTNIDDESESQATVDVETSYDLNAEVDDSGDTAQLISTKKESPYKEQSMREAKEVTLDTKAALLGRSVEYVEALSKSCPLDAKAIATMSAKETAAQYKSVPSNSVELPDQTAAEMGKNRYRNVLPNLHSAVDLKYTGVEGSTYINANFIRGLHGESNSYIATQGPTFETMSDFWRMVWEKEVSIVVMLTNLIENGRHKCVKYWPPANEKNSIVYGNIEVTRVEEDRVPSCYLVSHLSVRNLLTGEKRAVYHFWCIAWPDFGIPKVAEPILKLRNAVDSRRTSSPGPVVVHCSAGLGRSGTFIAIDMGSQQYQETGAVDPLKYLCEMRQDRGGMIQTQDQYGFVHQALAEYIN